MRPVVQQWHLLPDDLLEEKTDRDFSAVPLSHAQVGRYEVAECLESLIFAGREEQMFEVQKGLNGQEQRYFRPRFVSHISVDPGDQIEVLERNDEEEFVRIRLTKLSTCMRHRLDLYVPLEEGFSNAAAFLVGQLPAKPAVAPHLYAPEEDPDDEEAA